MAYEYIADPSRIEVPIGIDEIDALLQDGLKQLQKDPRKLEHLLRRFGNTLARVSEQIRSLSRDVEYMRQNQSKGGTATTLNPIDLVKYLSKEQLARATGQDLQDKYVYMQRMTDQANEARTEANKLVFKAKLALGSVLDHPGVPAEVKDAVKRQIAGTPLEGRVDRQSDQLTEPARVANRPPQRETGGWDDPPAAGSRN